MGTSMNPPRWLRNQPGAPWPKQPLSVFPGAIPTLCILLFLLVFGAFLPSLRNDFINYDDPPYVTDNAQVQNGLSGENVRWAFSSSEQANWHPLTWLSHMLDCQVFGLQPWGHHLTSVLLHTVNSLLCFLVLQRITGAPWRSWCVAALFGLHPLRVESVAWLAERKDVLSGLFFMLVLIAYAKFVQSTGHTGSAISQAPNPTVKRCASSFIIYHPFWYFYLLALVFFVLGLMSKPMLVTLPCIMLLLDFWPLHRVKKEGITTVVVEKVPFFLVAAASSVVTLLVQQRGGAVIAIARLPLHLRLENALVSYCRYLAKLFWPAKLSVFYPLPPHWATPTVLLAAVLIAGVSVFVLTMWRRHPYLPVGWFWFVGTLIPVIGLVQVGAQSMADRYSYLPSIGVFIALVWGGCNLVQRRR